MIDTLYREELLEHYRSPQNFGKLESVDAHAHQTNPLCGDDIEIWVTFDGKHSQGVNTIPPLRWKIKGIAFQGKGCAICIAGASMLTETAKGKNREELTKFGESDMLRLLGIEVSQTRKKCALLSLAVLKECLQ